MSTLEFPRVASSATSAWTEEPVLKVGTAGAAVIATAPVGKGIEIWLDSSIAAPETSIELPIAARAASAVVKYILEQCFGEI